ncbi:hypothetical protein [Methylobacterium sp. Leaf118]|uniref:hypothetical protein n=1 Tax=Methylobacterium sp. Leaf118 TaxID=2876562 RepID=UPI001E4B06FE|nr:hypothetical protein [Methylobacterium sp. Leaf118]
MNLQERYKGLPFSCEQVEEIGAFLRLEDHEQACFAAASLARVLAFYEIAFNAKKRMGPTDKVASKLAQISAAASALAKLLEDDAVCDIPFNGLWELMGFEPQLKGLDRSPLWRDRGVTLLELRQLIENVAFSSDKLAKNDTLMRGYYFLPPRRDSGHNLETSSIWPVLFIAWEQHGRMVAGSVAGTNDLHRFVNLVHEAAGLAKPNLNTLNRAVQRWKQDPRRNRPENAAWYFGPVAGNTDAIGEA